MNDAREYLEQHFATLQATGQELEAGTLPITVGGPRFQNALHQLSTFIELKDDFWTDTFEWALSNMGGTSGAEFDAWSNLVTYVAGRMPERLKNRPRG